jgi:hypothetical protein
LEGRQIFLTEPLDFGYLEGREEERVEGLGRRALRRVYYTLAVTTAACPQCGEPGPFIVDCSPIDVVDELGGGSQDHDGHC